MNIPIDDAKEKLMSINKPVAVAYNRIKNPYYENLKLEKHGFSDCVGRFVNEMLEIETYLKHYFENEIELKSNTIPNNYKEKSSCGLCEKECKIEDDDENPIVRDHCDLTSKLRGLAHDKCNLRT